jgi:DNA repair ATPase RecN
MRAGATGRPPRFEKEKNVSGPEMTAMPGSPTIPLTPEVRQAYQDLYDTMEAAIEGTTDVAVLQALNARQAEVDNVLTKDDMYRLHANAELFNALLNQINDTNDQLETLKKQISSIAAGFNMAAQVLAAINKVLTLMPGI